MNANGAWDHSDVYADGRLLATYRDSNTYFEFNDWLGSKRAQLSAAGSLQTYGSLPFGDDLLPGEPSTTTTSDAAEQHFTGKERDAESGLDYSGARYFGSSMGRFQSPDPSGAAFSDPGNPQSWNMYSYVQNNPLNAVDPDGLDCVYIGSDGSLSGFNSGDCDNSTTDKANSGYYFDGTVNTIYTTTGDASGQVVGVQGTTDSGDSLYQSNPAGLSFAQPNGSTSTSGMDTTINTWGDFSQTTQFNHGTHPFRDNNAGDIVSGGFVNGHGAIGTDGRFGVFPSAGQGRAALDALLHSPAYSSLSVNAAVARYAPAFENNTAGYAQFLQNAVGVSGNTPLSSLSPSQMNALENGIAHYEGAAARGNYSVSVTTN
jgi:RHS repeat-associated protein